MEAGRVADLEYNDLVTGNHIRVHNSERYVRFSVNDRDYFFNRDTGKFDGTGMCLGGGDCAET